jgi:hypothetical protein
VTLGHELSEASAEGSQQHIVPCNNSFAVLKCGSFLASLRPLLYGKFLSLLYNVR